jgi:hypothetical protein
VGSLPEQRKLADGVSGGGEQKEELRDGDEGSTKRAGRGHLVSTYFHFQKYVKLVILTYDL